MRLPNRSQISVTRRAPSTPVTRGYGFAMRVTSKNYLSGAACTDSNAVGGPTGSRLPETLSMISNWVSSRRLARSSPSVRGSLGSA